MKVEQVYEIVNAATSEFLGAEAMTGVDNTKIVDMGKTIIESGKDVDNYVRKLIDHVGKVVFVNRPYSGKAPSVLMDGWQFGSILEKIDADIPEAETNEHWNLQSGTSYDQDVFTPPTGVRVKFWNKRTTFEIPFSFSADLLESAFSNIEQLNGFLSMIYTKIETSLTIKRDALIMYTINNFIAGTLYAENTDKKYGNRSGIRAINLLYLYNQENADATLTAANCMKSLDFLKFAAYKMGLESDHMENALSIYNVGGRVRHTAKDRQKIILLDQFAKRADVYLQSDTFHNEFTKFPNSERVSFWQAPGTNGFAFKDASAIHISTYDPTTDISNSSPTTIEVEVSGILGIIFDRDALGVTCPKRKVTQHYNGKADFINSWYKEFAGYFNDFDENGIVFYVADATT